jgi:trehalose 6-phosphate phosphatase
VITLEAGAALLLDLDGTLIDIAPTPDSVVVPAMLPPALRALRAQLSGALAIVTGRTIEVVDALLGDVATAVAGEHGAAIRHAADLAAERVPAPPVPADWIAAGQAAVAAHPGALLERKQAGFVLHFRLAPEAGPALRVVADALAGPGFTVMAAKMAWEIKPAGIDKGRAVRAIMARAPFAGRTPVYIGDDTTDEAAIAAAEALGGRGYRVAETFGDPAGVRAWLAGLRPA